MRHTRSQTGQRRSHHRLSVSARATCANCQAVIRRHLACPDCGWYRGRLITKAKVAPQSKEKKS